MDTENFSPVPQSDSTNESSIKNTTAGLALIALGVVFGDIGTSPLYALRECFSGTHSVSVTPENVFGVVSVMFWTLMLIVSIKYVLFVLRADNRGEGGILALMTLANLNKDGTKREHTFFFVMMGILGAALLYSDGVITPAISVLSAIEGLNVATPFFKPFIVPLSLIVLTALFFIQSKGTAKVGIFFGPVVFCWFITIGILGLFSIVKNPSILYALNPVYAVLFLKKSGLHSFITLSSVFLAVTGAEVLYADLGHFGKKPIRTSWYYIVFPGLILNYLGQGAYLLGSPGSVDNLFFRIAPLWLLYPLVALATAATIIASQAVISGAFSLAKQSVQLGFWPRIQIRHTSTHTIGQVYVPFMNWCLFIGTMALILGFRESGNLASAYGIAVSGTMLITTVLIMIVARRLWSVRLVVLVPLALIFLAVDSTFFISNITKVMTGGWIVLVMAVSIFILMTTWIKGRDILRAISAKRAMDIKVLLESLQSSDLKRVRGTAVFLSANPNSVPGALLHNLKHNKVLHERTILFTVQTQEVPFIDPSERTHSENLGNGIYRVILDYGFSETPDIPAALKLVHFSDFTFKLEETTFFLGREGLVAGSQRTMPLWRKKIFFFMSHNAQNATNFFKIPQNRVVELGSRMEM